MKAEEARKQEIKKELRKLPPDVYLEYPEDDLMPFGTPLADCLQKFYWFFVKDEEARGRISEIFAKDLEEGIPEEFVGKRICIEYDSHYDTNGAHAFIHSLDRDLNQVKEVLDFLGFDFQVTQKPLKTYTMKVSYMTMVNAHNENEAKALAINEAVPYNEVSVAVLGKLESEQQNTNVKYAVSLSEYLGRTPLPLDIGTNRLDMAHHIVAVYESEEEAINMVDKIHKEMLEEYANASIEADSFTTGCDSFYLAAYYDKILVTTEEIKGGD